jgi:predicted CopG family antitoxin
MIMATKTISITEEAYERLKALKKDEKTSFSDVIIRYYPVKRKLADVLAELGDCSDLADATEKVSKNMRKSRMRPVRF